MGSLSKTGISTLKPGKARRRGLNQRLQDEWGNKGPRAKGRCSGHSALSMCSMWHFSMVMIKSILMSIYSSSPCVRYYADITALPINSVLGTTTIWGGNPPPTSQRRKQTWEPRNGTKETRRKDETWRGPDGDGEGLGGRPWWI